MNFAVPSLTVESRRVSNAGKSPAVMRPNAPAAGDTYNSVLVKFMAIGDQLKIQSIAIEHARNCAKFRDWSGVQLALAMLCDTAKEVRKIAAETNERLAPEMDDCVNVYGENQ